MARHKKVEVGNTRAIILQAQILNVAIQYIDAIKTRQIELVKVRGHLHEQQVALQVWLVKPRLHIIAMLQ
jgi:hypothetical protein